MRIKIWTLFRFLLILSNFSQIWAIFNIGFNIGSRPSQNRPILGPIKSVRPVSANVRPGNSAGSSNSVRTISANIRPISANVRPLGTNVRPISPNFRPVTEVPFPGENEISNGFFVNPVTQTGLFNL